MKKQGFTLIEVLSILIIMGVITLIAVPLVYSIINNSREGLYARQVEQLLQAGENWGGKNSDQLPKEVGQSIFLVPKDLANQGFLDAEEIIDPRDGEEMNGCIVVTKETKRHTYKYEETSCDDLRGEYLIRFDDNLNLNETVEVNSVYQPQNVTATSLNGSPVTVVGPTIINEATGVEEGHVNTSIVGTKYKLNYVATDDEGNSKSLTIKVTVVDTTPPEIVVQGKSKNFTYYYSTREGTFKIPTATVTDNSGKLKKFNGKNYKVTSNVSNLAGTYRIVYEAEDYSGNKRKLTVTVVIANTDLPVIKTVTGNPTKWQNKDVTLKVSEVSSKSKIVEYSFDDGLTWQGVNSKVFDTNQTVKIKAKDQDGNISETFEVVITKIDKEPPAKPTVTLHKNNSGGEIISSGTWVNTDVSQVQHTTDNLSGIKGYERSLDKKKWTAMEINAIETEEQEQHYYIRAKDKAGNVSEVSDAYIIRIDKTKPSCGTILLSEGTLGKNGWYVSSIKFSYTSGSDSYSGHESTVLSPHELTQDTAGSEVTLTTTDKAGNTCVVSQTYKIDKTPPTCGSVVVTSGTAGNYGWWRSDLSLSYNNGSDSMSGHDKTSIDRTSIVGETGGTAVNLTTMDKAGNVCQKAESFKIDKTPPNFYINVHQITHGGIYATPEVAFANYGIFCNKPETPGFVGIQYTSSDNLSGVEHIEREHFYHPGAHRYCGLVEPADDKMIPISGSTFTHFLQCNEPDTSYPATLSTTIKGRACDWAGNCSGVQRFTTTWNRRSMANLVNNKC